MAKSAISILKLSIFVLKSTTLTVKLINFDVKLVIFSWKLTRKFSKSTVLGKMSFFCWKSIVTNWITFNDISKLTGNDPKLSNCYVEYEKCISKSCKLMIFGRAGFFLIFLIRFWRFLKNKNCLCWIKNIRVYVNLKCFSI